MSPAKAAEQTDAQGKKEADIMTRAGRYLDVLILAVLLLSTLLVATASVLGATVLGGVPLFRDVNGWSMQNMRLLGLVAGVAAIAGVHALVNHQGGGIVPIEVVGLVERYLRSMRLSGPKHRPG